MYWLRNCPLVEQEHRKSKRQYAHVFHIEGQVCIAKAFTKLPERFRLGILMHELGHIWAGREANEEAANRAVERATGIFICYASHDALEYIDRPYFEQARAILAKEFR